MVLRLEVKLVGRLRAKEAVFIIPGKASADATVGVLDDMVLADVEAGYLTDLSRDLTILASFLTAVELVIVTFALTTEQEDLVPFSFILGCCDTCCSERFFGDCFCCNLKQKILNRNINGKSTGFKNL